MDDRQILHQLIYGSTEKEARAAWNAAKNLFKGGKSVKPAPLPKPPTLGNPAAAVPPRAAIPPAGTPAPKSTVPPASATPPAGTSGTAVPPSKGGWSSLTPMNKFMGAAAPVAALGTAGAGGLALNQAKNIGEHYAQNKADNLMGNVTSNLSNMGWMDKISLILSMLFNSGGQAGLKERLQPLMQAPKSAAFGSLLNDEQTIYDMLMEPEPGEEGVTFKRSCTDEEFAQKVAEAYRSQVARSSADPAFLKVHTQALNDYVD